MTWMTQVVLHVSASAELPAGSLLLLLDVLRSELLHHSIMLLLNPHTSRLCQAPGGRLGDMPNKCLVAVQLVLSSACTVDMAH